MRWAVLVFPLLIWGSSPSSTQINLFHHQAVRETKNQIRGRTANNASFALQQFFLWDYDEGDNSTQAYINHYAELFLFLAEEQIPKAILFPKDPDKNPFFQIANQNINDENSFAFWVNLIAVAGVQIEILFEPDAFNDSGSNQPNYNLPSHFYFLDLPQKMNWLNSLMQIVPGAISGVAIDPEASGSGGNDGYQQVINYIDQYRFSNGLLNLHSSMTLGIDAKPMTFANLDTFPTNPLYLTPTPPSIFFPLSLPSYRMGNNASLLNAVYLQAYEPDFNLIFTENLNPTLAADTFIQALQDIPYKTSYGAISTASAMLTGSYVDGGQFVSSGTITCTKGSVSCSYSGSNFEKEIVPGGYLDYNQNGTVVPIGQVASSPKPDPVHNTFALVDTTNGANVTVVGEPFILSQFSSEIPSGGILNTLATNPMNPNMKIGAIDGPIVFKDKGYNPALHQFNFLSGAKYTLTNQHFLFDEVVMKWIYPPITPAIASGINFMFSVQYDPSTDNLFFGNWTLANFMTFVNRFLSQVGGNKPPNPIFTDANSNGVAIPNGNVGIYDYYLLLRTNANPMQNAYPPAVPNPPPSPSNPWFPEFPL